MGYVLELLPKEIITENGDFLNAVQKSGSSSGTESKANVSGTQNIPSNIPIALQTDLDKAANRKAEASKRLSKLNQDLEYKRRLQATIKEKMQSDNTGAISEGIVMSGRCGQQTFDKANITVTLDRGNHAKGCSDPVLNPIGRDNERQYANNYWGKVLTSEISTIEGNIKTENDNLAKAEEDIKIAQNAITKYLQTKAEYDLKQAEAKNFPESQRIKAEGDLKLRQLEIEASERRERTSLRAKNIRIGLFVLGGLALVAGGYYLIRKKK